MAEKTPEVDSLPKTETAPAASKDVQETKPAAVTETAAPAAPAPAAAKQPVPASLEDAPDPEEDDLDDLDDMLDEFSPSKAAPSTTTPSASAPKAPSLEETHGFGDFASLTDDDFAKHLQDGMAELLGGMDDNPAMAAEFEEMMKKLTSGNLEGLVPPPAAPSASAPAPGPSAKASGESVKGEESFQDTIKKTMEKIAASSQSATEAAQTSDTDDLLAEMLKNMGSLGGDGGEGSEEDFSKMLLGMMEQLTNKEILYTPMKELDDKFPEWFVKNEKTCPKEDLERYKKIQGIVGEIVAKFEEKSYTDANAKDREYIVERMQLMQEAGAPPPDLVGDMPSAQEAFGAPDESCAQQ